MKQKSVFVLALLFSVSAFCGSPISGQQSPYKLSDDLEAFKPYLGTWEIESEWEGGNKLWAKNQYRVGLAGKFVDASTWAKDGDGEVYQRYQTVFSYDADKKQITAIGFGHDGSVSQIPMKIIESEGYPILQSQWSPAGDPNEIKQHVQLIDDDSYSWKVWSRKAGSESEDDWTEIMNGVWKKK